jgi:prevent-host-death family protein
MAYTGHQAKTHFSRLLKEAESGVEVIVMRGSKPVTKIVPIDELPKTKRGLAGIFEGVMTYDDKVFDPMTEEELVECGLAYTLDAPLVPPAK